MVKLVGLKTLLLFKRVRAGLASDSNVGKRYPMWRSFFLRKPESRSSLSWSIKRLEMRKHKVTRWRHHDPSDKWSRAGTGLLITLINWCTPGCCTYLECQRASQGFHLFQPRLKRHSHVRQDHFEVDLCSSISSPLFSRVLYLGTEKFALGLYKAFQKDLFHRIMNRNFYDLWSESVWPERTKVRKVTWSPTRGQCLRQRPGLCVVLWDYVNTRNVIFNNIIKVVNYQLYTAGLFYCFK